jgi:excisionase family DNA binding protein
MTHTPVEYVKSDTAPILPLLTPAQVAHLLQVHQATIYAWAADEKLPCVRIGKAVRFRQADIKRIMGD